MEKVSWSDPALADLEEIFGYIAADNLDAAARISKGILDLGALLNPFPHLGRPYPKIPGLRVALYGNYKLFYRIHDEGHVRVLRIWHGARLEPSERDIRDS